MGSLPETYYHPLFFLLPYGSLRFTVIFTVQAYVEDGWAFRMSCLKSPYLTSKPVEDPPHSRRYALGACGLHNCINMQLLCNYVD